MAKINFSRKEFEKHINLTPEMEEKISLFGTHFESADQENIVLEIMPNRPDLYSLQGFLRSFLPFIGKTKNKKYKLHKPQKNFQVIVDSSVKNIRPHTACAIVKNLKFDNEKIKEIIDIQEKIHNTLGRNRKKIAIGIYPLEKITLPIKFLALPPKDIKFIPLEMDRELNGLQILQQHPTGREYAHLLEGRDKFPIFMDAKKKILSMPPIINSHETGKITENTKDIFIECSGFDLEILKKTLNILVTLLADMHGEVYQMKVSNYLTPDLTPEKIKIDINQINKLLGLNLKEAEVKKLLEKMSYEYKNKIVFVPAYRADIIHQVDLTEDIAIAYGIENFEPELPEISTTGEIAKKETLKTKISDILTGLGLLETSSYHLLTKEDLKNQESCIEVENSKSDYKFLRPNLLLSTLKILSENTNSEYPQRIFELGTSFIQDKEQTTGIKESDKLVITLTPSNFTEAKQILEYLAKMLNLEFKIEDAQDSRFIEGRIGIILFQGENIGVIGEIHPATLKSYHLKLPLSVLEIDLEEIFKNLT